MSLHYIIDGYNLIRHASFNPASKSKDDRINLINFIRTSRICGSSKNAVTIVFDGYPGGFDLSTSDVEVLFSGEQSADDKIKRLVQARANPRATVVVTDDRQIRDFVRLYGITVKGIEEFLLPRKHERPGSRHENAKPEISYTQMLKINKEFEDIWINRKKGL